MPPFLRQRQRTAHAGLRMLPPTLGALLAVATSACANATPPTGETHTRPAAQSALAPQPGRYALWQDGEGGRVCKLTLLSARTIGGQALKAQEDCDGRLSLGGDPQAWFVAEQGYVVIIDATRRVLLRMEPLGDGDYRDRRRGDYVDAVILSPAMKR